MLNWILYITLILMALYGAVRSGAWTVVAAALFIPLTQVLPSPGGPLTASANLLLLALLVSWWREGRAVQPRMPLARLLVLMALFILLGSAHRIYLEVSLGQHFRIDLNTVMGETKEWLMGFLAYFLVFKLVESRQLLRRVWLAGLVCAGGEVLLAVYESLQGVGRATAHLDEPNRAGAYFAAAVALFLAPALILRGWLRLAAAGGVVLAIGAVFGTLSRGAMLAICSGSLLVLASFYLFVRAGSRKIGLALLAILILVNGSLLVPDRVVSRLMFTFTGSAGTFSHGEGSLDQSSEERLALWRAALEMMQAEPLGIGFYTFSTRVAQKVKLHKVAHNIYLQVGTELGIPALLTLVLLVLNVWRRLWLTFRRAVDDEERAITLGLVGAWTAMSVAVLFVNPLFAFNFSGQFWVLLAATLKVSARREAAAGPGATSGTVLPGSRARGLGAQVPASGQQVPV